MDEIDAALDFKNVSIIANYVKERTRDAQFVIISLRNNMFELADRLVRVHTFAHLGALAHHGSALSHPRAQVGIYKVQDVTRTVTIRPAAFTGGPLAPLPLSVNS